MHHAFVVATEEPAAQTRKGIDDEQTKAYDFHHKPHPIESADVVLEHAAHNGKDKEREGVSHNGSTHGDTDACQARKAIAQHDGIGNEGVGGIHGGHEHGGRYSATQNQAVGGITQRHRYDEAEQSEGQGFAFDALHVLQVHLERSEEHDIVEAHLTEKLEASVAFEHMQAVGADKDTSENHPHD